MQLHINDAVGSDGEDEDLHPGQREIPHQRYPDRYQSKHKENNPCDIGIERRPSKQQHRPTIFAQGANPVVVFNAIAGAITNTTRFLHFILRILFIDPA